MATYGAVRLVSCLRRDAGRPDAGRPAAGSTGPTLMDPRCGQDAVRLVRAIASTPDVGSEELLARLERLMRHFPPTATTLAHLDRAHARVQGTGGEEEFCVVTVLACATSLAQEIAAE